MLSTEQGVIPGSDFYIHTPSAQASAMFLYPVSTGYFRYLPGYCLRRSSYDSFLIMYMQKGSCEIETGGRICHAGPDQIVLLDCYEPHCYYTTTGWDAEWLHFDGSNARSYFKAIMDSRNPVINLHDTYRFEKYLHKIYISFKDHISIKEALLNNYIVNILTELLIGRDMEHSVNVSANIIEDMVAYINEHLAGPLTLEELREMDGEPVYIIAKDMGIAEWNVITGKEPIAIAYDCPMPGFKSVVEGIAFANGRAFRAGAYGITWLAYRRPPEGEANA